MHRLIGIYALAAVGLATVTGCATPRSTLQESQFVDDGVDYYSAEIDNDDGHLIYTEQWIEDENGDRVYTLNSHERVGANRMYVGDIRALSSVTDPHRPPELNTRGEAPERVSVFGGGSVIQHNGDGFNRGYSSPYGYRSSPVFIHQPQPPSTDDDQVADSPPAPQPVSTPPTPVVNPAPPTRTRSGQNRAQRRRTLLRSQPKNPAPKSAPTQSTD